MKSDLISLSRPEKDHAAQLHSLHELFEIHPEYAATESSRVKLVMVGGSRNAEDAARVEGLRVLAKELGIEVRIPYYPHARTPGLNVRLCSIMLKLW
jgi:alpha-1,2-mannosyltransferase